MNATQDTSEVIGEGEVDGFKSTEALEAADSPLAELWRRLPKHQAGLVAAILVMAVAWSFASPFFLTFGNIANIGKAQAISGTIAAAVTLVMLSGSVDISMGGVLALSGMASGVALRQGVSGTAAIAIGLTVGLLCGLINAGLVVGVRINPIVATLGTGFIFRGVAFMIAEGSSLLIDDDLIRQLGRGKLGPFPITVLIAMATFAGLFLISRYLKWGRHLYATGGDESAARRAGVRVRRIRTQTFILSAFFASVGGIMMAGQTGIAFPNAAFGTEFLILGAVIVGGTSLLGVARGGVGGTLLGVLLFGVMFNGFNLLGIDAFIQPVAQGTVLILAVLIDELRRRRGTL